MLLDLIYSENFDFQSKLIIFFTFLIALVVGMTVHEFAHSYVAVKCGDPTPKAQGRLTLNPMAHIEPLGLFAFLIFGFGWAKPVAINTLNFKKYKRDILLVSIAGILTNIVLAFLMMPLYMLFIKYGFNIHGSILYDILNYLLHYMISMNIILFVFNLFPIYPLDGFNAVSSYLRYENKFVVFMKKYGTLILLGFLISLDIVYAVWEIDLLSYLCYYITWPMTQFWSWVFGYGNANFNLLGFFLYGVG